MSILRVAIVLVLCAIPAAELPALQRVPERCDQYQAAGQADPNNVDAAVRLGQCIVRDESLIALGGDSTQLVFRTSWSVALRALRHAVELDPAQSRAYRPLFRILLAEERDGCDYVTGMCEFGSSVVRNADSVITIPRRVPTSGAEPYADIIRESRANQRASVIEARDLAERWAKAAPNDRRPHEYRGRALMALSEYDSASTELELAAALGTPESRSALFWDRFEALVKSDRGVDARRLLDEAANDPARDTTRLRSSTIASLNALLGRYRPAPPPPVDSARQRQFRARLDSIIRNSPPPRPGFSTLLSAGDSAGARRALAEIDSAIAPSAGRFSSMDGPQHLTSAKYHLALRDTTGAESQLAEVERILQHRPLQYSFGLTFSDARPWMGHAWSLAGDVAAARGRRDEAARMYRRVIGLWSGGDADVEPVVQHARVSLESLSRRR